MSQSWQRQWGHPEWFHLQRGKTTALSCVVSGQRSCRDGWSIVTRVYMGRHPKRQLISLGMGVFSWSKFSKMPFSIWIIDPSKKFKRKKDWWWSGAKSSDSYSAAMNHHNLDHFSFPSPCPWPRHKTREKSPKSKMGLACARSVRGGTKMRQPG